MIPILVLFCILTEISVNSMTEIKLNGFQTIEFSSTCTVLMYVMTLLEIDNAQSAWLWNPFHGAPEELLSQESIWEIPALKTKRTLNNTWHKALKKI